MLTQAPTFSLTRTVDAPATEVYRAFVTPSALRDWLCDAASVDPRPGGRAYFWWNDGTYSAGVFKDLARAERLVFTWQGPGEPPSTVTVALAPTNGETAVTVTVDAVDDGPAPDEAALSARWEAALENLQSVLETGIDLRVARRPMFGLSGGGDLDADRAAKLGVPVTTGLWIGGLVEGLGAHTAGLQRDDVVVRFDDQPITDFVSFARAIRPHQAGDQVPVVYYRGAEQRTTLIELAQRPRQDLPETAAALAAATRQVYATVDAELDTVLAGVTDAIADVRPEPGQWNIKDVLAHLIAVERDTHIWIVAISEDSDLENPFHNNVPQRINGLTTAYPTLAALLEELHRAELTTLVMVESLSAESEQRHHLLRQLGGWLTALPDHSREHFAEIQALKERATAA
jgi:uncharacterized protein YndB with AHSA1/START domain